MLNLEDWLDMHESPKEIGGIVCYVRSHDVAVLVDQIRREKAQPVSVQQDVEEFIRDNEFFTSVANPEDKDGTYSVSVYDIRAWMAGHARVPVEATHAMKCEGEHVGELAYEMAGIIYNAMLIASKERTE